ncbi:MAG: hypothetical protein E2590_07015 [Chryseobacterium sp.]|nr:hypothetical protein [Chryseobacterium sp.]
MTSVQVTPIVITVSYNISIVRNITNGGYNISGVFYKITDGDFKVTDGEHDFTTGKMLFYPE